VSSLPRTHPALRRVRRRSVAFLDREGETWACFLVTFRDTDGRWKGYFSFRPQAGDLPDDTVRTADIFIEGTEAEIDERARGLGRPLLSSLLASALHLLERDEEGPPRLRTWFRSVLSESSLRLAGDEDDTPTPRGGSEEEVARLRSLYASYRLDQVAHLIALVTPEDFERTAEDLLDGTSIDFRGRDRLQLAMMVVEQLENLLPLPPFEIWVEDFLANREAYRLYAHTLHRLGRLP
jgi:hypothetical protein